MPSDFIIKPPPFIGEAVVLDAEGRSNLAKLQADLTRHGFAARRLYAFDLMSLDGEDLQSKPREERRLALDGIMPASGPAAPWSTCVSEIKLCGSHPSTTHLRLLAFRCAWKVSIG